MRTAILAGLLFGCSALTGGAVARAQDDLQIHYDWRHTVDARNNERNFPSIVLKRFKALGFGSFLFKMESDLNGSHNNVSQTYFEISHTLRFWQAPVYGHLEYTGGLGLFDSAVGGYYLENAYLLGLAYPFQWRGSWASAYVAYKHTNFRRPSRDPQASVYWGRAFGDRWSFASTAVLWTQNKNHGDAPTAPLMGKQFTCLVENEVWFRTVGLLSIGSLIRVSDNVYVTDGRVLVYPTVGVRYLF